MNFQPFYEQCERMCPSDKQWADVFCRSLDCVFGDSDAQLHSVENACKLFYGFGAGLSKAQYYRKRKLVLQFYRWLLEQSRIDQATYDKIASLKLEDVITAEELDQYYFKSLDSLLGFIRLVGRDNGFSDEDGLLNIRALAILAWYGVDIAEMVSVLKADLNANSGSIHIRGNNERTIVVGDQYVRILQRFANTDRHAGFPSGKMQEYLPSRYLFRSAQRSQMQPNNLNCCLKRFNDSARRYGHTLSLTAMKKNGIFSFLSLSDERSIAVQIQDMTQCDRFIAFEYAHFYTRWRQKFLD